MLWLDSGLATVCAWQAPQISNRAIDISIHLEITVTDVEEDVPAFIILYLHAVDYLIITFPKVTRKSASNSQPKIPSTMT